VTVGTPRILFTGFTVGPAANNPQRLGQSVWSIRDDFTYSFNARGRHDLKLGGEYLYLSTAFHNYGDIPVGGTRSRRKPIPQAGKTLLRLIVPCFGAGTPIPTPCRQPAQRFSCAVTACSNGFLCERIPTDRYVAVMVKSDT
jgi:hypothetical protein